MARSDEALDRLVGLYSELALSAASIDDLLRHLDDARRALRGSHKGENPLDAALAGFTAGFAAREALQGVPPSRRPDVARQFVLWLPDVVALEDRDYRTVQSWASRAARARVDAKDSFKRVRA